LLHGFQDTGDTFQFLVDEFGRDRPLAAIDWRGLEEAAGLGMVTGSPIIWRIWINGSIW